VSLYSTNGLKWSPENLVDRREFIQYKWLEVVTREAIGQVCHCKKNTSFV